MIVAHRVGKMTTICLYEAPEAPRFARGGLAKVAQTVRRAGRHGDEVLIHVNPDELRQMKELWGPPQINPNTGLPEYGFLSKSWKKVKKGVKSIAKNKLFQMIAPIALNFLVPGLGAALGGALGASGTAATVIGKGLIGAGIGAAGGGKKGALAGLISGGMSGGGGGALGKALGATGKTATTVGNSLLSGLQSKVQGGDFASGAISGGLSSALTPGGGADVNPAVSARTPGINPGAEISGNPDLGLPGMHIPAPTMPEIRPDGFLDKLKEIPGKAMGFAKEHPFQTGALALALAHGAHGPKEAKPPPLPEGWNDPLPVYNFDRKFKGPARDAYYTYGEMPGGEQQFFEGNDLAANDHDPNLFQPAVGKARGGALSRYVSQGTGATGRADNIDAKLSENEYIIDAETVALLGDGSPDAGAKKLDAMRAAIRAHKGKSLMKGKISPNAKGALQYLRAS